MKKLFTLLCLFMAISFTQSCSKDKTVEPIVKPEPDPDPDPDPDPEPRVLADDKAEIKTSLMDMMKMMETYPTGVYSDAMSFMKEEITYTLLPTKTEADPATTTSLFVFYAYKNFRDSIYTHNKGKSIINHDDGVYKLDFSLLKGNYFFDNTKKEFIRTENENSFVLKFPANANGTVETDNVYSLSLLEYVDKEVTLFINENPPTIIKLLTKGENIEKIANTDIKAKLPTKAKAELKKGDAKIASINIESVDYTLRGMPTKIKGSIYAKPFTLDVDINRSQERFYDIKLDLASSVKANEKLSATIKLELSSAINDFELMRRSYTQIIPYLESLNINLSYEKLTVKGDVKNIPAIIMWMGKMDSPMEEINRYVDLGIYLEDVKVGDITASIVDKPTTETTSSILRMPDFNNDTQMLVFNVTYYDKSSENAYNLYKESFNELLKMINDISVDINSILKK
ncbi:MAG: hypothetical protein IMY73_02695 [Bacteroidetes bacterium]|nr:hypothetical protein [Bacteroidota bacterium]